MGIEPTSEAWEASILPLYDARSSLELIDYTQLSDLTNSAAILHIFHNDAKPSFSRDKEPVKCSGKFRKPSTVERIFADSTPDLALEQKLAALRMWDSRSAIEIGVCRKVLCGKMEP
jgi:hypothetical protein